MTVLPANIFPSKVALRVAANIPENLPFCCYTSFSIVSLTPFISKPDSSRDLTVFMISFKSSFENANGNVALPDPKVFFWVHANIAEFTAVNLKGTKMLLANCLNTFPIKGKRIFSKGPTSLLGNPPNYTILDK